ncbi:MAG: shikimate dehydrogenase [Gemmatimonadetes bacterium]|nr:shikimate dehydrogenase [Gemmatimonadota bacterium]
MSSPARPITAATRVIALLGDPVAHSLSPITQNAAFQDAGLDGVYVACRCTQAELPGLLRGLALAGGGGNVTLPHKEAAAAIIEARSPAVRRTGACNTFWAEDGVVHGDNTDVAGFRRAAEQVLGAPPAGTRVLVLGAGGAARAVLAALLDGGAEHIAILNRTLSRAQAVASRVGDRRVHVLASASGLDTERFDLLVNATRLGLSPDDALPLGLERVGRVGAILDLVYGMHETALVGEARKRGIPAANGAEMLVAQGAASFELWWRQRAPISAMRRALEQAVAPAVAASVAPGTATQGA